MTDTITCAQLIEKTRRWVNGSRGALLNRVSGATDAVQTEITVVDDPGPISTNTYVGLDDEMLYIWEVDRGAKTLTVSRGVLGTDPATHLDAAVIESGARFPRIAIKEALQDEIRSWPHDIFQVKTKALAASANQAAFDLGIRDSDFYNVFQVERSPILGRTTFTADRWSSLPFRTARKMPRDVFPSGTALFMATRSWTPVTLRVMYSAPFDVDDISDDDDIVEDWGLARSMCDIPPMGAAARLVQASEILRTNTESLGESRIASEIPPSYQSQTATALRKLADVRIRGEAMKLRGDYPMPSGMIS